MHFLNPMIVNLYNTHTLRFFFKFVSRANNSKSYPPTKRPRKQKKVALEKFLEQIALKLCHFWEAEALKAGTWDYLNIILAQKWYSNIFQISTEKSFQAWQKKFSALIEWK